MFAVIKTGGKQYKVAENDQIVVEKLDGDAGSTVTFEDVLIIGDEAKTVVGAPLVSGARVVGEVVEQRKGDKIVIMKKRQRSTYRRKKGHRQLETVVSITSILADGKKAPAKTKAAPKAETVKASAEAPKAKTKPAPATTEAPVAKALDTQADDLTKMKGLGKVFAAKLTDAGITTFTQIAEMSAADIEALEEKLGASGKFEKNDWVAQAKDFAKGG